MFTIDGVSIPVIKPEPCDRLIQIGKGLTIDCACSRCTERKARPVATAEAVARAQVGATFRTIGCARLYRITHRSMVLGFIPAVIGVSLCGKFKTDARVADIIVM